MADACLDSRQLLLIKESWFALLNQLPAESVGGLLFKHIFEQADVSAFFSFARKPGFDASPDAVAANTDVRAHGAVVVGMVTIAVGKLAESSSLVPVLKDLGARHATYGIVAAHYPIVGAAFLKTLRIGLDAAFTAEVEAAYTAMWGVVASTMLSGAAETAMWDDQPRFLARGGASMASDAAVSTPRPGDALLSKLDLTLLASKRFVPGVALATLVAIGIGLACSSRPRS